MISQLQGSHNWEINSCTRDIKLWDKVTIMRNKIAIVKLKVHTHAYILMYLNYITSWITTWCEPFALSASLITAYQIGPFRSINHWPATKITPLCCVLPKNTSLEYKYGVFTRRRKNLSPETQERDYLYPECSPADAVSQVLTINKSREHNVLKLEIGVQAV